jgi:hypothetical protein
MTRILLLHLFFACSPDDVDEPVPVATSGEFTLLTYNVAGLPEGLSHSHPEANTPQISPLLNDYDLVLAQEDFWYHNELAANTTHPHQSDPMWDTPAADKMGDGLNRFSSFAFGDLTRVQWVACNGFTDCASDCLATKGFSMALTTLAGETAVDVYNLHAEAGSCEADIDARNAGLEQFVDAIASHSPEQALIVAGDTNLHSDKAYDSVPLENLLSKVGLTDACRDLECGDERIDRVMFRNSPSLTLTPLEWSIPPEFVDAEGNDLSDHEPVAVRFHWAVP